jgi:predicted transposase YdaD
MISREMMRESLAVQEWLEEGRQEGLQAGLQQGVQKGLRQGLKTGRLEEARFALVSIIEARFPDLNVRDAIRSISQVSALNSLIPLIAKAPDAATVSRVVGKRGGE